MDSENKQNLELEEPKSVTFAKEYSEIIEEFFGTVIAINKGKNDRREIEKWELQPLKVRLKKPNTKNT